MRNWNTEVVAEYKKGILGIDLTYEELNWTCSHMLTLFFDLSYLWGIETYSNALSRSVDRIYLTYEELKPQKVLMGLKVKVRIYLTYEELKQNPSAGMVTGS